MAFQILAETITLAGNVVSVDEENSAFSIRTRSGDVIDVQVGSTTYYEVLTNVDGVSRNRMVSADAAMANVRDLYPCIAQGTLVYLRGVHQQYGDLERFEARTIYLLQSTAGGKYVFEEPDWWLVQISRLADRWLDELFDANRDYTVEDFSRFYRTNLNITGHPADNDPNLQECATLSRLIYGLSSAYLLTGSERYYLAARAAVGYQRQAFRVVASDGEHVFWAFGRRRLPSGEKLVFASENADDRGTIPLYEQIYALAGLTQFYRITADWQILDDIRRTLNTFDDYFRDTPGRGLPGHGGYFSHLDPVTMRPDSASLGQNQSRKNWNSIGDHIPAYLVNLVLAMDPAPVGPDLAGFLELRHRAITMLDDLVALILDKFPDAQSDYVNERFFADWRPDHGYSWQQNRGIVGHNLKISWNLTRCAFNLHSRANHAHDSGLPQDADALDRMADRCIAVATRLGDRMTEVGVDPLRGGVFDAVLRNPTNGLPVEFAWGSTKDFWQQEQGVLAYLLMYGATRRPEYQAMARECMAFWNLFFLDRDRQGVYFRTTEDGLPITEGVYGQKGSHSMAGYHALELNYLAHIYVRSHVEPGAADRCFSLYFHVLRDREQQSINVLPDFMPSNQVEVRRIRANGLDRTEELRPVGADDFQIRLDGVDPNRVDGSIDLVIEYAIR